MPIFLSLIIEDLFLGKCLKDLDFTYLELIWSLCLIGIKSYFTCYFDNEDLCFLRTY